MNTVKYYLMDKKETAQIISLFVYDDCEILPTSDAVFKMFPNLKNKIDKNDGDVITKIFNNIENDYNEFTKENSNIVDRYEEMTKKISNKYFDAINEYFNIDKNYNITIGIGKIPIFPRNIEEETYYIGNVDDSYVLDTFMHEVCHFAFFQKCSYIFKNIEVEDFDKPSLLWYLSEIAVDPILNKEEFQQIFKHQFFAYDNFYDIKLSEDSLIDKIRQIFIENDSDDAIIKSYQYLLDNELEFRTIMCEENYKSKKLLLR